VLLAGTALLLLVAWVQVAALMSARAAGRAPEIGVRLALGAGRLRLMRHYMAEGLLITGASLALALTLAPILTSGVVGLLPEEMTRGQALMPDSRAFAFAAVVSLLGVLLLSLAPMDAVRRQHPLSLMRGTLFPAAGLRTSRLRLAMLVGQLAITVVLFYMAGLAARSMVRVTAVDLGFEPAGVIGLRMPPVSVFGSNNEERRAHIQRQIQRTADLIEALRVLPGVTAVAGGALPFYDSRQLGSRTFSLSIAGASDTLLTGLNTVTADYARVLDLTLIEGRIPFADDLIGGERQALINHTLSRRLAGYGPVVGQRVTANNATFRVAGVVKDFISGRPDRPVQPELLALARPPVLPQMFVLAKVASGDSAGSTVAGIRATFDRIWTNDPSRELLVASDLADRAVADYRARATMLTLIAVMCLPLALVGIVGALSYTVEQRKREIGIRLALGAEPSDIRNAVVRSGLGAIAGGLVVGLAGGVGVGRLMSAYLFGVQAIDPLTVIGVAVVIAGVGWCAAWLPARRASGILPAVALRDGL
jgi:predicted permease